jgi:hypothetical protein
VTAHEAFGRPRRIAPASAAKIVTKALEVNDARARKAIEAAAQRQTMAPLRTVRHDSAAANRREAEP